MTEPTPSTSQPSSKTAEKVVWLIIKSIGYVFTVLMLGLIGALLLGGLQHETRRWGWVAGAALAVIGYPLGWASVSIGKLSKAAKASEPAPSYKTGAEKWKPAGPLATMVAGLIFGLIVGGSVGFVVLLVLLSLALSPFTPDSWRQGFTVGFLHVSGSDWFPLVLLGSIVGGFVFLSVVLALLLGVKVRHK